MTLNWKWEFIKSAMRNAKKIFGNVDWMTICLFAALVFFGWINIYASQYNDDQSLIFDFSQRHGKQLIFIVGSFFVAFIILIIDWKFLMHFPIFYMVVLFFYYSDCLFGGPQLQEQHLGLV